MGSWWLIGTRTALPAHPQEILKQNLHSVVILELPEDHKWKIVRRLCYQSFTLSASIAFIFGILFSQNFIFFIKKTLAIEERTYRVLLILWTMIKGKREIFSMTGYVSFTQTIWATWEKQVFHLYTKGPMSSTFSSFLWQKCIVSSNLDMWNMIFILVSPWWCPQFLLTRAMRLSIIKGNRDA